MNVAKDEENNGRVLGKKRRHLRKKRAAAASPSSSSDNSGDKHQTNQTNSVTNVSTVQPVKRRLDEQRASMVFTTKKQEGGERGKGFHTFSSSGMDAKPHYLVNDATRSLDLENDDRGRHTRAAFDEAPKESDEGTQKIYKGMQGYKDYRDGFRREDDKLKSGSSHARTHGPSKPSANYRMSVLVDYQPDVCKDYKETGYCGFGDSCKFLHDRGDYKAGWQLDRDWEEEQKARKERERQGWVDANDSDANQESDRDDEMPFACFICREPWASCTDPVVTTCGHYFCEQCALKHNAKTGKCFACNEPTRGIFNVAHDIIKREKAKARDS